MAATTARAGGRQVMRLVGAGLVLVRGGREVFRGLSFTVGVGEALLVPGPNGVGKSSLLRLVAGLVRPRQGRLEFEGRDLDLTIGEQAHYLGHQDALKPSLSVQENLDFWAHFLGGGVGKRDAALAAVGLDGLAQLPAIYLSAGQRRRLSLARLIAVQRPIWLRGVSGSSGASGCSMTRPLRSMRRRKRCWPLSCAPISPAAGSLSPPPTDRSDWMGRRSCLWGSRISGSRRHDRALRPSRPRH